MTSHTKRIATELAGVLAGVLGAFFVFAGPGSAAPLDGSAPAAPVLTGLKLHDPSVMQSFAYDPVNRVWIFAQVTRGLGLNAAQHAALGDMTLTRVSASGVVLGYKLLRNAGHGVSIGVELVGTTEYIWTEFGMLKPSTGYGAHIARFKWANNVGTEQLDLATSPLVIRYGVNAGMTQQAPSINNNDGLIGIHYQDPKLGSRWAVYNLAAFKQRNYISLFRTTIEPLPGIEQGWAFNGDSIAVLTGHAYDSTTNPPPGDTMLSTYRTRSTNDLLTSLADNTAATLDYREPEGMTRISDTNICTGFASGPAGARLANVYCQTAPVA
jgi:hypothetical protein